MAEAKKGGSNEKGAKGKKPKGKEADSKSNSKAQTNPAPKEETQEPAESKPTEEAAAEASETSTEEKKPETTAADSAAEKSEETKPETAAQESEPAQNKSTASSDEPKVVQRTDKLHQQRVSRILDAVLDEPVEESPSHHGFKHPLFLDVILAVGLLVAMAGFSIGMFKIYITHSAKQSINQQNYRAAIALLRGTPLPGFFNIAGSEDSVELLNRALYLDAITKLEINRDDAGAIEELQQIRPGSGYFELAQDLLRDNSPPPKLQLEGGASHDADPNDPEVKEDKPIVPDDDLKDGSP